MQQELSAHLGMSQQHDGDPSKHGEEDEDERTKHDDLQFSERTLPAEPFAIFQFGVYCLFLVLFCIVTIGRQGEAPFQLAKFARDQIGHDEFLEVGISKALLHRCPSDAQRNATRRSTTQ